MKIINYNLIEKTDAKKKVMLKVNTKNNKYFSFIYSDLSNSYTFTHSLEHRICDLGIFIIFIIIIN